MRSPWIVACTVACTLLPVSTVHAFDYFEHRWLGDVACQWAQQHVAPQLQCTLQRRSGNRPEDTLTFGDLVALAADHFDTPEDLRDAIVGWKSFSAGGCIDEVTRAREHQLRGVRGWLLSTGLPDKTVDLEACSTVTSWLAIGNSQQTLDSCIAAIEQRVAAVSRASWTARRRADCYVPTEYDDAAIQGTPGRLVLAIGDQIHFGYRAEQEFNRYRVAAIEALRKARAVSPAPQELDSLAVVQLAFALHFYTDRFASGHIRTNPMLAVREVKRRHNFDDEFGLRVLAGEPSVPPEKKHGDTLHWHAYGDSCLFGSMASEHRAITAAETAAVIVHVLSCGNDALCDARKAELAFEVPAWSQQGRKRLDRGEPEGNALFPAVVQTFDPPSEDDGENSPVPPPPGTLRVLIRPGLQGGIAREGGGEVKGAAVMNGAILIQLLNSWAILNSFGLSGALSSRGQRIGDVEATLDIMRPSRILTGDLRLGVGFSDQQDGAKPDLLLGFDVRLEPPSTYALGVAEQLHFTPGSAGFFHEPQWLLTLGLYFEAEL